MKKGLITTSYILFIIASAFLLLKDALIIGPNIKGGGMIEMQNTAEILFSIAILIYSIVQLVRFKKNDDVVKFAINYISGKKCEGFYPAQIFLDRNAPSKYKKALEIFHKYEERKDQMYALDFDDLLLRTIEILNDFDDVREKWQRRITNIPSR